MNNAPIFSVRALRTPFREFPMIAIVCVGMVSTAVRAQTFEPDRDSFFKTCRLHSFRQTSATTAARAAPSPFNDASVASINGIFDKWKMYGDDDQRKLAFILATAKRESQGTWEPVREVPSCGSDEGCRERAIGKLLADRGAKNQKPVRPNYAAIEKNGQRYYGRGYIQITLPENYRRAGKLMGVGDDLYNQPDKVMEEDTAQTLLVKGMMEGWFGVKKPLSRWFNAERSDWIHARDNVNPGSPHKPITAESAKEINECLHSKS
jgi:hypothetical protein